MLALLIMSHQAIALMSLALVVPITTISIIGNSKKIDKIQSLFRVFIAILLGAIISAYIWVPYLIYSGYNLSSTLFRQLPSFVGINEILYSPWRLGFLFQGPKGELSFLVGYAQLFILLYLFGILLFKRFNLKYAKETTVWLITVIFLIFMLTQYSAIIWLTVPIIKNMLLSYRVLSVITLCISVLAGYFVLLNLNRKILIYLVIIFAIGTTMLNWGNRRVIPQITDTQLINNLPLSSYQGEGLYFVGNSIFFSNKPVFINKVPKQKIEVLQGQAKVKILAVTSTKHSYLINSTSGATLKENTLYYPGWIVKVNGKTTQINFKNKQTPGIITFTIPKGNSKVEIIYKDPLILQVLKTVFALSLALILSYSLLAVLKNKQLTKAMKRVWKQFS
jgi:hypothetical protein